MAHKGLLDPTITLPIGSGASAHSYARRAEWVVTWLRWLAIATSASVVDGLAAGVGASPLFNGVLLLACVYNAGVTLALQRGWWHARLSVVTTTLDIGFCTLGCALTGGVTSELRYLFFLTPVTAGLRFEPRRVAVFVALASLAFILLGLLQGLDAPHLREIAVLLLFTCFSAIAVGALSRLVIHSREELEREVCARTDELDVANAQLRRQADDLRALDRLKDQFLSVLSHELRTPINAITGFGSILDDEVEGPLNARQHEVLGRMLAGADILLGLIDDLLDMSRMQAGKFSLRPAPMAFDDVAGDTLASLASLIERKGLTLALDLPAALPPIEADAQRIAQVLTNLVGNAIKFTPPGGQIAVCVALSGEALRCEVRDSGPGIAREDLPRLFQRFGQLDMGNTRSAGGVGLGLSIAKGLVEAHGGAIGVESTRGVGSTFWFSLPLGHGPCLANEPG